MMVELLYAGIPRLGFIAVHYWFVTHLSEQPERFEVWQTQKARPLSKGHLCRNLMSPYSNVGGSPTRLAQAWIDEPAQRIHNALVESWNEYPHLYTYRYIPGPNSNTYVAWILKRAEIEHSLDWRALGKGYAT